MSGDDDAGHSFHMPSPIAHGAPPAAGKEKLEGISVICSEDAPRVLLLILTTTAGIQLTAQLVGETSLRNFRAMIEEATAGSVALN